MDNKASTFPARWLSISGALIALLGIVHLASTRGVMWGIPESVPGEFRKAFLFVFASTGAAVVFAGLLVLFAAYGIARMRTGVRALAFSSGIFTILLGVGAAIAMPQNAFSYVLLFLGLSILPPLMLLRRSRFESGDVLGFHREAPKEKRTLH